MLLSLVIFIIFNVLLVTSYLFLRQRIAELSKENVALQKAYLPILSPLTFQLTINLLNYLKQKSFFVIYKRRLEKQIKAVYGHQESEHKLVEWVAHVFVVHIVILELSFLFALLAQDYVFIIFGICVIILYSSLYYKQLAKQKKIRDRLILRELPEWLSKMVLLVQAGETIQQAFIRTLNGHEQDTHPLYSELKIAVQQLKNRVTFVEVLDQLSQRCQLQEMTKLTTTFQLYHQRGGVDFSLALKGLADELWEKRKAMVKQQGEEAASKLVIPLVIIFIGILIIIAWPALQLLAH